MIKIPYRYLVVAVVVFAAVVMLMPAAGSGSLVSESGGKHLIVIERMDDSDIYFRNQPYKFNDNTIWSGLSKEELAPGVWLLVTIDEKELGRHHTLKTVEPAPTDKLELSGTIGSLLQSDGKVVGFTLNNMSIMLPSESGGHGGEGHGELTVGLGIKVEATPERGATFLRALEQPEVIRHHDLLHAITILMLQLAIILLAAKIGGELFERFLGQPGVLGELIFGVIISPYALGSLINIPGVGRLFQTVDLSTILRASPLQPNFAVSPELWAVAQMAAIVLLFMAGLETDMHRFLRYAGPATIVAMGGVITPFFLGAAATWWFIPGIESMWDPTALFMGAVMVATSVGITARVLSDINRLDTSEGVTILAAAVIDDVLGILVLAIVNAIAMVELAGGTIDVNTIIAITLKAVLFWLGLTGIGILVSKQIEKGLRWFKSKGATFGLALALAFACSATAELFGLAMIIGAYSIGLALSDTKIAHFLEDQLRSVYEFIVPVFFVVMGMMVDFNQMLPLLWPYGVVISFIAVISKVFGCGIPAMFVGFNFRGAYRIGIGMLPRGEVALIIAGVGIANGVIATDMFGVAILLTLVTTLMAPPALVPAFKFGGPGDRKEAAKKEAVPAVAVPEPFLVFNTLSDAHQGLVREGLLAELAEAGYSDVLSDAAGGIYEMQKGGKGVVVRMLEEDFAISIDAPAELHAEIRDALHRFADNMLGYREKLLSAMGIKPQEA
jgi:Kef-type K+ transport system membrane component KefB